MSEIVAAAGPALPPARAAWSARTGATVLLALTAVAAAVGLVAVVTVPPDRAGDAGVRLTVLAFLAGMLALGVVGRLVITRRPAQAGIGWSMLAVGALGAAGRAVIGFALADPSGTPDVFAWATNWIWVPGTAAVLLLLLRFPTGALPNPRWRWLERAVLAWGALTVLVTAAVPGQLAVTPLDRTNPYGVGSAAWLEGVLSPLFAVLPALTVASAAALLVRYRRAAADERQQLRWVAAAVGLLAVASPLAAVGDTGAALLEGTAYLLLPSAVVVAVLRFHLWDLGLAVRRGLAYALTSGLLLAVYVGAVTLAQGAVRGWAPDAIGTAVVAVTAVPVLTAVQRALERLLYGDRRDPDRVVAQLADRLAATPEALLPQVVTQVRRSLRLPYVAIELADGTVAATDGVPVDGVPVDGELRVPLQHAGATVGWLLAGRRSPSEALGGRDVRLLERVAAHAGLAVQSMLLATELQHASDRLRTARAAERARLRADLHDELGPALGAISMRAEAARNLLPTAGTGRLDAVLRSIEDGADAAVGEVRRILADLQPRVLEEEGLRAALEQVIAVVPAGLRVELDLAAPTALPPEMELAAYRVAAEALRNVIRHADATTVRVSLSVDGDLLELRVVDDGVGLPADPQQGVGLSSMRSRAAELGGTCAIESAEQGGTVVRLRLPLVPA